MLNSIQFRSNQFTTLPYGKFITGWFCTALAKLKRGKHNNVDMMQDDH